MKRLASTAALIVTVGIVAPTVRADVKTQERTVTNMAGMLGAAAGMFGGAAAKDGVVSTVAVKGSRKLSMNDTTGTIVDLAEQKVYTLDVKRKLYTVMTFDQRREQMNQLRADAGRRSQQVPASTRQQGQDAAKQMETDFDLKETGQHKQIAGYDTRQVIMTVTTHEKGRKVEDSGGYVMTTDMWIAPKIAALDEIAQFDAKYAQIMYAGMAAPGVDSQQAAQMAAMYPSMAAMNGRVNAERGKMTGTQLVATVTFDMVQSAEAVKAAAGRSSSSSGGGSGGSSGLGAILGRRRGGDPSQPRTTVMTTVRELVSIATAATAADVAIPAGYTEKK